MAANETFALMPVMIVGIVFFSIGLVAITTISIVFFTLHRQKMRTRELGYRLVMDLLDRGVPSDEIVEILSAWQQNKELAERLLAERRKPRHDEVDKLAFEPSVRAKKPALR